MLADALQKFEDIVKGNGENARPAELVVEFPCNHPLSGVEVGSYLLKESADDDGSVTTQYVWHPNPALTAQRKTAETVEEISLLDVESARRFLVARKSAALPAFLHSDGMDKGSVTKWALNPGEPERGSAVLAVNSHPQALAWAAFARNRSTSHEELANFLLDHAEELEVPMLAKQLAVLRHARKVDYSSDLDTGNEQGVRATFGATTGSANVGVPREIRANVIPWAGLWPSGEEPVRVSVLVRIRLVPPKDDSPPRFSMVWSNEAEATMEAVDVLRAELDKKLGDNLNIMRGVARVERWNVVGCDTGVSEGLPPVPQLAQEAGHKILALGPIAPRHDAKQQQTEAASVTHLWQRKAGA